MDGSTRFQINSGTAAAKEIDGEVIVINVVTGLYYSLEGVGALAWNELVGGAAVAEAAAAVAAVFDVKGEIAEADLAGLVEELVAEGLLVHSVEPAPHGAHTPTAVAVRRSYTAPSLSRFDDMEDLLAFDPPLPTSHPASGVWRP